MPSRPQVSFFLFIIFTVYAMLPLGMRDAAAAGLASSLSHLLVLGLYLGPQPDSRPALLPQVSTHIAWVVPGAGTLPAFGSSEHPPTANPAVTPGRGTTLSTEYKHRHTQMVRLRSGYTSAARCLRTAEEASGSGSKGAHQRTIVVGTDVNNGTFTENVKIVT